MSVSRLATRIKPMAGANDWLSVALPLDSAYILHEFNETYGMKSFMSFMFDCARKNQILRISKLRKDCLFITGRYTCRGDRA